jgi:hypothetical protein
MEISLAFVPEIETFRSTGRIFFENLRRFSGSNTKRACPAQPPAALWVMTLAIRRAAMTTARFRVLAAK